MPQQIELSADRSIQNMYATDGRKLKTTVKEGEELMDGTKYYKANFVFDKQKEMEYILFDEGRIVNDNGNFMYEYHLKDHLGSVRVAFVPTTSGTEIVQENAYYPFGGTIGDFSYSASENRYKHTGMEAIDDFGLNMLDNNARWRDVSAVPRFYAIDPLAEKYYHISPYAYCANNPVKYVDPDGREVYFTNGKSAEQIVADLNTMFRKSFDLDYDVFSTETKSVSYTKTVKDGWFKTKEETVTEDRTYIRTNDGFNWNENKYTQAVFDIMNTTTQIQGMIVDKDKMALGGGTMSMAKGIADKQNNVFWLSNDLHSYDARFGAYRWSYGGTALHELVHHFHYLGNTEDNRGLQLFFDIPKSKLPHNGGVRLYWSKDEKERLEKLRMQTGKRK